MESLWADREAAHKAWMRRDNIQLSILVTLSAILCLGTVVLVGSDLLLGRPLLKLTSCHEQSPASGDTGP